MRSLAFLLSHLIITGILANENPCITDMSKLWAKTNKGAYFIFDLFPILHFVLEAVFFFRDKNSLLLTEFFRLYLLFKLWKSTTSEILPFGTTISEPSLLGLTGGFNRKSDTHFLEFKIGFAGVELIFQILGWFWVLTNILIKLFWPCSCFLLFP